MPSCNTYRLTWVSLTLGMGYLLTAALPDLQRGIAPLGPPAPAQPGLLGRRVAPPTRHPWPRGWGLGYFLLATAPDLGRWVSLLSRAPDLGRGVAPLHRSCAVAVWYSQPLPLTSDVG